MLNKLIRALSARFHLKSPTFPDFPDLKISWLEQCCNIQKQQFQVNFRTPQSRQGKFNLLIGELIEFNLNSCNHQLNAIERGGFLNELEIHHQITMAFIHPTFCHNIQMKKKVAQQRAVVINLRKTPLGYQVDDGKKSDNKKSLQLSKSLRFRDKESAKQQTFYADSMHKSEYSNADEERGHKNQIDYQLFDQNSASFIEAKQEKIEIPIIRRNIPPRPQWFDISRVDKIEEEHLGEFFKGNSWKTPDIYVRYRNFIVNTYELDPSKYFSKVACRRILHGDACSILRIHSFLEQNGIINRGQVYAKESMFAKPATAKTPERQTFKKVPVGIAKQIIAQESKQNGQFQFKPNFSSKPISKTVRALCPQCKLPAGVVWLQMKTNPNVFLCLKCYDSLEPEAKEEYQRKDITKNIINPKNKTKWQMEEHGKLLSTLSSEDLSWDKVFEEIPGKTSKQQIIFHFIHLPSSNMQTIKPPAAPPKNNNQDQMIRLIDQKLQKSQYTQSPSALIPVQHITLSEHMVEITSSKLDKFRVQLETTKTLDRMNYHNTIIQNPTSIVSRIKILKNFDNDRNLLNSENRMMVDSEPEMEPMNLGEDNFFTTDFNTDNFGRFDDDEDDIGDIFNVLND